MNSDALERLKRARKDAGLTQRQAANLLSMKFTDVSMCEAGALEFTDEQVTAFCKIYEVSKTWVLTGKEIPSIVTDFIKRLNAFASGEDKRCPYCNGDIASITLYEKIEPEVMSLYVHPCGCRLGLWGGAPKWAKEDGLPIETVPSMYNE